MSNPTLDPILDLTFESTFDLSFDLTSDPTFDLSSNPKYNHLTWYVHASLTLPEFSHGFLEEVLQAGKDFLSRTEPS